MSEIITPTDCKIHLLEHKFGYPLTEVIKWQSLLGYALDISKWRSISQQPWEKAPHAISVTEGIDLEDAVEILGNGIFRTLRTAGLPSVKLADGVSSLIAFGGPCLLTTGDLTAIAHFNVREVIKYIINYLPRLDQVIDAVGVTNLDQALIIFEDDLFLKLLKRNFWYELIESEEEDLSRALKELAERTFNLISNWLTIAQGKSIKTQPIFTSQVHNQLEIGVAELAEIINIPRFTQSDRAVVELTYTGLFQAIASTNGYIQPNQTLICAEPYDHFSIYKTTGPGMPIDRKAALSPFYQQNLFGMPGHNENMAIAGFVPMFSLNQWNKNVPCSEIINQGNITSILQFYKQKVDELLVPEGSYMPFPLGQNQIFTLALNLLFWDPKSRQVCHDLKSLSDEYYQKKKEAGYDYQLKQAYRQKAYEPLQFLINQIGLILEAIGYLRDG